MKTKLKLIAIGHLLSAICLSTHAQGTAFTYQGRLTDGANPANGNYELRFILYTADPGGNQVGPVLTNATIANNGLFTAVLDFGANVFTNTDRFLEIAVRTNGGAGFTTLSSRQKLMPTPYAIFAGNVGVGGLSAGTYSSAVTFNNAANNFNGSHSGNGGGLTNLNAATLGGLSSASFWRTNGNANANPANGAFLGTTDTNALEFKVNGQRALRIEHATNSATGFSPNMVAGYSGNIVSNGFLGAVIGGGGFYDGPNRVGNYFATVVGGVGNIASGTYSTAMGYFTAARGTYSTAMGAGSLASGDYSTAMGFNTEASGDYSTGMGSSTASGFGSTAMGVGSTASGNYSTAMGRSANAVHQGSFVWADSQSAEFDSQRANQFRVRAEGGARFDFNASEWVDLRYQSNLFTSPRIISTSSGGYLSLGGAWVNASDQARKNHFTPVDPQAVLAKVAALPLSEWSYRNESASVRHVGPMAQDFHAAFGLGGDDKSIATVDADGVALAAIQGLNQKTEVRIQKSEVRIQNLEAENAGLKQRLEALEKIIRHQ